jgi:glutamine cyclotransferase
MIYRFKFLGFVFMLSLIVSCNSENGLERKKRSLTPAKFDLPYNNTNLQRGKDLPVEITIDDPSEITHLKVFSKDSVYFDGKYDSKELDFIIPTSNWSLGTKQLSIEAKTVEGKIRKANRIVRVLSDVYPEELSAEVVNSYPHSKTSYTQGLEFFEGQLYEGTGGMGRTGGESRISLVDYKTGEILNKKVLDDTYFGEGITVFNQRIYQLTWQQNKCFVYDLEDFSLVNEFAYTGEGWGMTNNGKSLIMSDGTERLYFRNPKTFALEKTIEVYSNSGPIQQLNELEFIDGKIFANVYQTDNIVVIEPSTGAVESIIDLSLIALEYRKGGEVLNGIAYNKETKEIFVTGKNWPNLLEIDIRK